MAKAKAKRKSVKLKKRRVKRGTGRVEAYTMGEARKGKGFPW